MSSLPKQKNSATEDRIVQILCDAQAAMQGKVKVSTVVMGSVVIEVSSEVFEVSSVSRLYGQFSGH